MARIIISGGGTGGHIFPAISIANALKEIDEKIEILFVGAEGKIEMEKVPAAGYKIIGLPVAGFQRRFTFKNVTFFYKLIKSMWKARSVVKEFKPDVAVGVGGYASGPVLKVASGRGVPTLLQEQNSFAGVTNRLLAKKAAKICVAYENMQRFFPAEKIIMTGNPVRKDLNFSQRNDLEALRQEGLSHFGLDAKKKIVLVVGGSLGARTLNESMIDGMQKLASDSSIQVIWQTGKLYIEEIQKKTVGLNVENIKIMQFVNRMDLAYAVADVVISRAGAGTISELCVTAKPCILVPSPNVSEDHQTQNALALVNQSAAIMVKDTEAKEKLINEVMKLIHNSNLLEKMKQNIVALAKPDAAKQIANEILKLIQK